MNINNSFVTVCGKRFHYVWLRDNCLSPKYRKAKSFQSIYDISDRKKISKPLSVKLEAEKLIIDWDEEPAHRSIFPVSWLLSNAYDPEPEPLRIEEILWDKQWLHSHLPEWNEIHLSIPEWWIEGLLTLGFAIVKDIGTDDLEAFLSSIGQIHHSEYGKFVKIKAAPTSNDIAGSDLALPPHTDFSYFHQDFMVQFLYCVENDAFGGESILVDSFCVAEDFRRQHPEYFQILAQTPIQFRQFNHQWQCLFSRKTPIIKLDAEDKLTGVYFSPKNRHLNPPFDQMEKFYEAYSAFFRFLKNPDYQYRFRLEPGDCLLVNNFRVLHGRHSFLPNSGVRHLEVGYIPGDYILGRYNYRKLKHLYAIRE